MLTSEESKEVRKQLIEQVESSFPDDKKEAAKQQVESMSDEELENFIKRNSQGSGENNATGQGCIFCSIASGNSESYKIAEDSENIAVLEINPISRGHTLVLPKKHGSFKDSPGTMEFAKQVAITLREKLSPKDIELASMDFQGHGVINLIPVYTNETIKSERHHADKQELEKAFNLLKKPLSETPAAKEKPKKGTIRKPRTKKIDAKKLWLPKRIP